MRYDDESRSRRLTEDAKPASVGRVRKLEKRLDLLESQARLPELRERLAISIDEADLVAAASEANERTGRHLEAAASAAFARIVVDVINRGRS